MMFLMMRMSSDRRKAMDARIARGGTDLPGTQPRTPRKKRKGGDDTTDADGSASPARPVAVVLEALHAAEAPPGPRPVLTTSRRPAGRRPPGVGQVLEPPTTVSTAASTRMPLPNHEACWPTHGMSVNPTADCWATVFTLAIRRAGSDTPRRPSTDRYPGEGHLGARL